jgi:hypothetical protein
VGERKRTNWKRWMGERRKRERRKGKFGCGAIEVTGRARQGRLMLSWKKGRKGELRSGKRRKL